MNLLISSKGKKYIIKEKLDEIKSNRDIKKIMKLLLRNKEVHNIPCKYRDKIYSELKEVFFAKEIKGFSMTGSYDDRFSAYVDRNIIDWVIQNPSKHDLGC